MGTDPDMLARLKEVSGLMTAREVFDQAAEQRTQGVQEKFELEQVVQGEVEENDAGTFFLATRTSPVTERHGNVALMTAQQVSGDAVATMANDDDLRKFRLDRALFLDTETTGLAGGTGTYSFLVGVGRFEEGNFVLRQYFMRDFDEEEAMLVALADLFRQAESVVTYNGKSFDIPLLQTRFITSRIRINLEDVPHLDMLHVARRLWRARLKDCSLSNVEREVLELTRHGDIPSHLIPQIYFNYLRTRDARRLAPVFYHNEQDILSLAGLASRAAQLVTAPPNLVEVHPLDLLSLARLHFRQRRYPRSERHASDAYDSGLEPDDARHALYVLALSLKRQHRWEQAHSIWRQLAKHYPDDVGPRIEMAKHLEHRERDLTRARVVCLECVEIGTNMGIGEVGIDEIRYRLARIERKIDSG
jgi:uncharacterized protein YprB with RNaseH-like and TPR domain